ncbi:MAG TPA: anaerobic ribonucleoside-triphosphate reductase activating protein [Syntrophales bacterium]|nr:anaerobic ribonucleoside-triphosphate reductase activating protein [Syntrophales bacterium]HRT62067.1 anaerobic ribonucleoside-triphosphate reductase activating protein [Syntrophales bacterium]
MKIGGLHKVSLIDYPGKISTIIFTQGCNFRCPYCHNPELVDPKLFEPPIPHEEIIGFLDRRRRKLDAVVVTGGEPTLQPNLIPFLRRVKEMGYLVKIDTNGALPEVLENLIAHRIADYIAMDVKAPLEKYTRVTRTEVDTERIRKSIDLVMTSGIPSEFRTTIVAPLVDREDIRKIGDLIRGARRFVLQKFVASKNLSEDFQNASTYPDSELEESRKELESVVDEVVIR